MISKNERCLEKMLIGYDVKTKYPDCSNCGASNVLDKDVCASCGSDKVEGGECEECGYDVIIEKGWITENIYQYTELNDEGESVIVEGKWRCCKCDTVFEDEEAFERVERAKEKQKRENMRKKFLSNFKDRLDMRLKGNKERYEEIKDMSLKELKQEFGERFELFMRGF